MAVAVVQTGLDLGGVPLMVQLEQPVQDLLPHRRPDRVPGPLPRVMEPMVQPGREQVIPPVSPHHSLINTSVNLPQLSNVRVGAALIMHEVVGRRQSRLPGEHQIPSEPIKPTAGFPHLNCDSWKWKGFKHIGKRISKVAFHR